MRKKAASPTLYSLVDRTLEQSGKILMPGQKDVLVNYLMSTFPSVADEEAVKQAIMDWLTNKSGEPAMNSTPMGTGIPVPSAGPVAVAVPAGPMSMAAKSDPEQERRDAKEKRKQEAVEILRLNEEDDKKREEKKKKEKKAAVSNPVDAVRIELSRMMSDAAAAQGKLIEIEDPTLRTSAQNIITNLNSQIAAADKQIQDLVTRQSAQQAPAATPTAPVQAKPAPVTI